MTRPTRSETLRDLRIALEALEHRRKQAFFTKEVEEIDEEIHKLKAKEREVSSS